MTKKIFIYCIVIILIGCTSTDKLYLKAKDSFNKHNYIEAIDYISKAIKKDKNNPKYYNFRSKCYVYLYNYKKALEDLNSVIQLIPDSSTPYQNRAATYLYLKDYKNALTDINISISKKEHVQVYFIKAEILLELKDTIEACKSIIKAQLLWPDKDTSILMRDLTKISDIIPKDIYEEQLYKNWGYKVTYTTDLRKIKNGPWHVFYANGNIHTNGNYKNGKKTGLEISYYDNGQIMDSCYYKDGLVEGISVSYHRNGQVKNNSFYIHDKLDSVYREWSENGKLVQEIGYKNNEFNGIYNTWDDNGKLLTKAFYLNGNLEGEIMFWDKKTNSYIKENYKNGFKTTSFDKVLKDLKETK
jgi:antitoxin component YwqK of YwqJK toxin-antitoxin module